MTLTAIKARLAGELGPRPWKDGDPRVHCTHCNACGSLFPTDVVADHRPHCWARHAREDLAALVAEVERLRTPQAPTFDWTGDLDDDCVCRSVPGYVLHAEAMDDQEWWCSVGLADGAELFNTSEADIFPLTGQGARKLAEMVVVLDTLLG